MVLLIIDTQKLITNNRLYHFETFVSNIITLIGEARQNNVEVIYVRHDDGPGNELTKGNDGYEIYEAFAPVTTEKVFDKNVNSAFNGTGLLEYLKQKRETNLIIAGLQTEYCIDASIKCGFEHGFHIIVPSFANTTFDNGYLTGEQSYNYYNEFIWNHRYAECVSMEEIIQKIRTRNNRG